MAEYSAEFEKAGGYSFDRQTITDLWKQAQAHTGKDAKIDVKLEGSQSITTNMLDELFEDTFVRNSLIERLSISSHEYSATPTKTISIILRNQRWSEAVSVSISGNREECTARLAEISKIVDSARAWYSRFIFSPVPWFGTATLGLSSGVLGIIIDYFLEKNLGRELSSVEFWMVFVGCYVSLSIIGSISKRIMFPKMIFEIGKSSRRAESAKAWRNVIGIGVVLAIIVGIISGLIVEKIK